MNPLQEEKVTLMLPPELKDDGDFTGTQVPLDLAGAGAAKVEIIVGGIDIAAGSTDEATPPILEECDTNSVTAGDWAEIPTAKLAAVIGAGDDNKIFAIDVPFLPGRKRFVRVKAPHAGNGSTGVHLCIRGSVTKLAIGPATAAERGYAAHITG